VAAGQGEPLRQQRAAFGVVALASELELATLHRGDADQLASAEREVRTPVGTAELDQLLAGLA
jgi:hypothetical protein